MLACPIPPIEHFIPVGRNNRPGGTMTAEWITIHDTGDPKATAEDEAAYLARNDDAASAPASWHFTVDDRGAYQHLPLTEHGWHAADGHGPGNLTSVGVEICENTGGDRAKAEANAATLVAWLLIEIGLDVSRVVPHRHWYPKDCPHLLLPRRDAFLGSVLLEKYRLLPQPWDPSMEIALLARKGIITGMHKPTDRPTWGELATVLNRLTQ